MLQTWLKDESGQTLSEYGLLVAVIAVAIVGAVVVFRDKIQGVFTTAGDALSK
ncbi:MAG: Flp family type IVb pilin [Candidatus Magasanikbacteria bacterium]|nr:Flp family type IVb pilin [Candidatus Magasanikbacteria bacterium]